VWESAEIDSRVGAKTMNGPYDAEQEVTLSYRRAPDKMQDPTLLPKIANLRSYLSVALQKLAVSSNLWLKGKGFF
jgi:hypothetical protein